MSRAFWVANQCRTITHHACDGGMQVPEYHDCTDSRELRSTELVINKLPVIQLTVLTTLITADICIWGKEKFCNNAASSVCSPASELA
jgi:hypothetical protein